MRVLQLISMIFPSYVNILHRIYILYFVHAELTIWRETDKFGQKSEGKKLGSAEPVCVCVYPFSFEGGINLFGTGILQVCLGSAQMSPSFEVTGGYGSALCFKWSSLGA